MDFAAQVKAEARKFALQNAVFHEGKADASALMGKLLGTHADWRARTKDVNPLVREVVAEVNALAPDEQRAELERLAPELLERKAKDKSYVLKPLPNADKHAKIVMRFAPNPNGPATFGQSRGMVTLMTYKRMYKEQGKPVSLILRYDDTDPATKTPMVEAYDMILKDYEWLGENPDVVFPASDRIDHYYRAAEELIGRGGVYVCQCSQEAFKAHRDRGTECEHRAQAPQQTQALWKAMLDQHGFKPGEAVLRVKTDMAHKDPALRDWVGFRILLEPHPRTGTKYRVWPMLDFESAVEDHLQGVTHIIRGKDLIDSTRRQQFLYRHLGWTYPETMYWGRVRLHEFGKFSTSGMKKAIASGLYEGWTDVRLPTLGALRRRGYLPEALVNFWLNLGLSEKDVAVSVQNLDAENRKLLEPVANRYFFVHDPVALEIDFREPTLESHAPLHPDHAERGSRKVALASPAKVWLNRRDVEGAEGSLGQRSPAGLRGGDALHEGDLFRLKDLGNFRVLSEQPLHAQYEGNDLTAVRQGNVRIVHWVADADKVPCEVLMPIKVEEWERQREPTQDRLAAEEDEAEKEPVAEPVPRATGFVERAALEEKGERVQFERFAFVRLEDVSPQGVRACYLHR